MTWHVLDASSIWMKEFSSALSALEPTLAWVPHMSSIGCIQNWERDEVLQDPPVRLAHFPLQRGYARFPISLLSRLGSRQSDRLARKHPDVDSSPLVCTTPFYAPVAEQWSGPVIYYLTDLTIRYAKVNPAQVRSLDIRMCRAADLVCPNSTRIASYLESEAGCSPAKVRVIPNATRAENLLPKPMWNPGNLPEDISDLPRPIAGIIGNLSGNMDWELLNEAMDRTGWLSWVLVGPTDMPIAEREQSRMRKLVMARGGRIRFTGSKHYGALRDYARSFDVAILPYTKKEPTYSGSSTRFYEHLAAGRPMLATRGFEELLHKEPLLRLVNDAGHLARELEQLRSKGFQDEFEELRWISSKQETWSARAVSMRQALSECSRMNPHATVQNSFHVVTNTQ